MSISTVTLSRKCPRCRRMTSIKVQPTEYAAYASEDISAEEAFPRLSSALWNCIETDICPDCYARRKK